MQRTVTENFILKERSWICASFIHMERQSEVNRNQQVDDMNACVNVNTNICVTQIAAAAV